MKSIQWDCGTVLKEHLVDEGSEWRTFGDSDKNAADPNRVGGPENPLLQNNLTTSIQRQQGADVASFYRLSALQHRQNAGDQQLLAAFHRIADIASALQLGSVVQTKAQEIFKLGTDRGKVTGRGNKAVYGACVYLACQEEAVPRNPKEILAALGGDVRQKSITKYINILKTLMKETKKAGPVRTAHPSDFLDRFLGALGATQQAKRAARELANAALPPMLPSRILPHLLAEVDGVRPSGEVKPWDSRQNTTVAAAITYIVTHLPKGVPEGHEIKIEDITAVTGAAVGTIRDAYKQLSKELKELLPSWYATNEELDALLSKSV